jgi:hypothetical protein
MELWEATSPGPQFPIFYNMWWNRSSFLVCHYSVQALGVELRVERLSLYSVLGTLCLVTCSDPWGTGRTNHKQG